VKLINRELIDQTLEKAAASERRRTNFNLHNSPDDSVQRYLIATTRDSYFRPHRHPLCAEVAIVLRGTFEIILFDDTGNITERHTLGPHTGMVGFEMEANAWHCWLPLSEEGCFFEVKPGPYDPATAAGFAPWAPEEGTPEAAAFVAVLRGG
jgi:cupin fold WbuC family metalloprotein